MSKGSFIATGFQSAELNMNFDRDLLYSEQKKYSENSNELERILRCYVWPRPSVTYSYKQALPKDLLNIDSASRVTGGGIVFHSTGDLVFSCVASINDAFFPKRLKNKMALIADILKQSFREVDINLEYFDRNDINQDIKFCNTYFSPFELYSGEEKVLAMTLRKLKTCFLIQGIVHLYSNHDYFSDVDPKYKKYFTKGLTQNVDIDNLVIKFKNNLGC
jgi:hypothetical protein